MSPIEDDDMKNGNGLDEPNKKKGKSSILLEENVQPGSHDPEDGLTQSKLSLMDQLDALSALADRAERGELEEPTSPTPDPEEQSALSTLEEVFWGHQDIKEARIAHRNTPASASSQQRQREAAAPSFRHETEMRAGAPSGEDAIYTLFLELKRDIDAIKHEHREEALPSHERELYNLLAELRHDIDTIKDEQHESHVVSAEERELYAMLGELRRDINQIKSYQGSPLAYEAASRALVVQQAGGRRGLSNRQMLLFGFIIGFLIVGAGIGGFILASRNDERVSNDGAPSQRTNRLNQIVFAEDVSGMAGEPIKLDISGAKARAAGAQTIMITGLPKIARLSAGKRENGAWILPASGLANLSLQVPSGYSGTIDPSLALIDPVGNTILRQSFQIGILSRVSTSPPAHAGQPEPEASTPAPGARLTVETPKLASNEEKELLANAQSLLDQGDIVSARRVLDFAVSRGSIAAAFTLAQTYDPEHINKSANLFGVQPDLTQAKVLYYFAAKGGNKNAAARLAEINKRHPSR